MFFLYRSKAGLGGIFLLLIALGLLPACRKDFLNRKPLGNYTSEDYPYPQGGGPYDQYIFSVYASLRSWGSVGEGYIAAVSIRSDDAVKGSTPADGPVVVPFENFPVPATNGLVNTLWTGYYDAIAKCNVVLHQIAIDSVNTPEAVKMRAKGEARFLRGYCYFMLVRLFGNVPIVDTILGVGESNVPQSSPSQVYAFIEQDLQFAASALPLRWDPQFVGRATSGAANGMLAKVYLYEKKWQQAMATAGIVISSGVYDLNTPYDEIFTESGENSSGSIFEIQCYSDANHPTEWGSQYAQVQGVRGAPGWDNLGWGFNVPSEQLLNAYEPGDPRIKSTILFCPSPEPTRYGEVFPVEPNPRYNMKVYTNPAKRAAVGRMAGYWVNIRVLRYSDVVLMYAEAANELGQTDEALEKLEWVRAHARNGDMTVLPKITERDKDKLRDIIHHERHIELAMESQRFFDIVRWGIADQVLHTAGISNFNVSRDKLLPIPQEQIDLSKGVLKQNPGY